MSSQDREWISMLPMRFGNSESDNERIEILKMRPCQKKKWAWLSLCLIQACLIITLVILIYLNRWQAYPLETSSTDNHTNNADTNISNVYRIYSNGINSTRVLTKHVEGCNQREHDIKFGVSCAANNISSCQSVEGIGTKTRTRDHDDEPRMITTITTSKAGDRMKTRLIPIKKVTCLSSQNDANCRFRTRLRIHLSDQQQSIIGWGGSLTDSTINNILSLSINGTRRLLDDYFSKDTGLGYNMVRVTIGGSDFSGRFYTNNDLGPKDKEDLALKKFHLSEEDTLYKIPLLRQIINEYNPQLKVFGSMWSPPTWMKTNNHFNKGLLKGSINSSSTGDDDSYYHALAGLKTKFLLAYQKESIRFWGLTVMNEPFFAVQPFLDFNTMIFPVNDYSAYVANVLGPKLRGNEDLKDIKIMLHDDNRRFLRNFTDKILSQIEVQQYVDGIATHGYIDEDYDLMSEIHEKYGRKFFLLSDELCSGHLPFMEKALIGNWARGVHYGLDIIRSLQHRSSGWVDWNMALDTEGGPGWLGGRLDSPIIVDKTHDTYHKSPMYYVLGHFSRYIPEGSIKVGHRINNNVYDYHFETVSFLSPNKNQLTTVVLNDNPYYIDLSIEAYKDLAQLKHVHSYQVKCEPNSITTLIAPLPIF